MTIGTRSLLFGAHQFALHPVFVLLGWWKLWSIPRDLRVWAAAIVHDWGYVGKPNMDGPEGKQHPRVGAMLMGMLFDKDTHSLPWFVSRRPFWGLANLCDRLWGYQSEGTSWYNFTYFHSRDVPVAGGQFTISRLCYADKMAIDLTPAWLYLPLVEWTGEIKEYTKGHEGKTYLKWYKETQAKSRDWVYDSLGRTCSEQAAST